MRPVAIALLSVSLLVLPALVGAETYVPLLDGGGGMMLNGAVYQGDILAGGITGDWSLDFDDSLWPDDSDSTARFDYIWTTFFADNYDGTAGQESWRGYFDGTTLPTAPRMSFFTAVPGGDLVTNASVTVLIRDDNGDEMLQQSEKHGNSQVAITVSVETPLCTGYFEDYCGNGSFGSGNFNFVNPPTEDGIMFNGQLQVFYCGSPVEESSWGTIKALFH
jgi:hypothetical protein